MITLENKTIAKKVISARLGQEIKYHANLDNISLQKLKVCAYNARLGITVKDLKL